MLAALSDSTSLAEPTVWATAGLWWLTWVRLYHGGSEQYPLFGTPQSWFGAALDGPTVSAQAFALASLALTVSYPTLFVHGWLGLIAVNALWLVSRLWGAVSASKVAAEAWLIPLGWSVNNLVTVMIALAFHIASGPAEVDPLAPLLALGYLNSVLDLVGARRLYFGGPRLS